MPETLSKEKVLRVWPVDQCWSHGKPGYDHCVTDDCAADAEFCVAYLPAGFEVTDMHQREDPTLMLYRRERHVCKECNPWPEAEDA